MPRRQDLPNGRHLRITPSCLAAQLQPQLQKLLFRPSVSTSERAGINRKAGRREERSSGSRAARRVLCVYDARWGPLLESPSRFQEKYFWFWSPKNKNAFALPCRPFPPSPDHSSHPRRSSRNQQEGGKAGRREARFGGSRAARHRREQEPARFVRSKLLLASKEIFLILVPQKQKCVLASLLVFPASRLPVDSLSLVTERPAAVTNSSAFRAASRQPKRDGMSAQPPSRLPVLSLLGPR